MTRDELIQQNIDEVFQPYMERIDWLFVVEPVIRLFANKIIDGLYAMQSLGTNNNKVEFEYQKLDVSILKGDKML